MAYHQGMIPLRPTELRTLVRHEDEAPRERSTCGWRYRLLSALERGCVAAWVHVVDIDDARPHFHRRATELYYVLEGEGTLYLDGQQYPLKKGSIAHIPPGVVHAARGRMRVLVVGIPEIAEDDVILVSEGTGVELTPESPQRA